MKVGIIDVGMGNVSSLRNALLGLELEVIASSSAVQLSDCSCIFLPGVGKYDHGMALLKRFHLDHFLHDWVANNRGGLIGICLGMQLLFKASEEGIEKGLGFFDQICIAMPSDARKVPNMGWRYISYSSDELLIPTKARYYFVHSYFIPEPFDFSLATTEYDGLEFCCALRRGNVFGFQFHPERSHLYGTELLRNTLEQFRELPPS